MKSRLYEGQVRHRRFSPRPHSFDYRLYMLYLDLEELPALFDRFWFWSARRPNIAWFRRADHLGDTKRPLIESVREEIMRQAGVVAAGPIRLLTHCRYFGFGFNPVSFYYCFDKHDTRVETIVAEVNNTPWGEQYCYVLSPGQNLSSDGAFRRYRPGKNFHVSPFMPMEVDYDWRFSEPRDRLSVHMENHVEGEKLFDATLDLHEKPLNSSTLASSLLRFPLVTVKVVAGIYYEALRIFIKRIPFYEHPDFPGNNIGTKKS